MTRQETSRSLRLRHPSRRASDYAAVKAAWATIFLGSFLAFLMQPLTARALLPSFGGVASVWIVCLSAFQALLVAGYWYAHLLSPERLNIHLGLLALAAAWLAALPIFFPAVAGWLGGLKIPAFGALAAVAVFAGVPYVLFAANASVVQRLAGGSYRLYAASNIGSFAGLFCHPIVFEPFVPLAWQWRILAAGTVAYAALLRFTFRCAEVDVMALEQRSRDVETRPRLSLLVAILPAVSCFMLNAATAHATSNIVPLPLLWAVLLGAYLLTFAVGFSAWGERLMPLWSALGLTSAAWAVFARFGEPLSGARIASEMCAVLSLVVFGGAALHAWLCRLRPASSLLTRYNLMIAVGGATGGLLAGVAAPLVTDSILEWPVALIVVAGLLAISLRNWAMRHLNMSAARTAWVGVCVFAGIALAAWTGVRESRKGDIARGRSFYGAWRVCRDTVTNAYGKSVEMYELQHGGTLHGVEPVNPLYRNVATAYYGVDGGGLAFTAHPLYRAGHPVRAGIVGLGVGTMAFYGRKDDTLRFYEICPQMTAVAKGPWFDYLGSCSSNVEVVHGDARRTLEEERTLGMGKWDILVVDAYSGDSIPLQLVTEESFWLYRERLADGGVLALNLSNWHVDLVPAAKAAARLLGLSCQVVMGKATIFSCASVWAFLSERPLELPLGTETLQMDDVPVMALPRDDCGGLLPFVRIML